MAAGPYTTYQAAKLALTQAALNLSSGSANIFAVLLTSAYTPAPNTHATYADISGSEATGTGYTAGGQALTGVSDTAANGTVTVTATGPAWANSTITAKYVAFVYRAAAGTAASTDKLVSFADLNAGGGSISSTNGPFTVPMNPTGIFTLT